MSTSHKSQAGTDGRNATDSGADSNKDQAGPDRLSPELDNEGKWGEVAADDGFQKGDQGGYKGSYDETKYQQIADKDMNPGHARGGQAPSTGHDDGKKSPMKQNTRTTDDRADDKPGK